MIDPSRLVTKQGNYRIAFSQAVTDMVLLNIAAQYESQVSRKMFSLTAAQLSKRFSTQETILVTTKVDGEGVFIYFEQGQEPFVFNAPSGRVRVGLPALGALKRQLQNASIQKGLFRAELYLPLIIGGRRAGVADVMRVSFNGTADEIAAFRLVMLDIIMLDGKDLRSNQTQFTQTWDLLGELFSTDMQDRCYRAEGVMLPENEIPQFFEQRIAAGEEGLVIRRLQRQEIYKVKPQISLDAVVIGYVEGEFEGQYGMTSLLVALTYPIEPQQPLMVQTLLRVGSGFSDEQRAELLHLFAQIKVPVPLAMTDLDGRPVSFIRPEYIIEVNCEDMMRNSPGSEKDNRTQVFVWQPETETYAFWGIAPCPRPIFATYAGMRPDKQVLEGGARLDQIVNNPQPPQPPQTRAAAAKVIRREVYQKGEMVRKLVIVAPPGEETIPYLIYWTDFSAKRKSPLDVSVSYAYTEERAEAIANQLISKNIVRGWKPVES